MVYRTARLRQLDKDWNSLGGLAGAYRSLRNRGYSRKQIAEVFGMGVPALALWVTKWNKEAKQCATSTSPPTAETASE